MFQWKTLKDQRKEGNGKGGQKEFYFHSKWEKERDRERRKGTVELIIEKSQVLPKWEILS